MIVEPPVSVCVNARLTDVSDCSIPVISGAGGGPTGVTAVEVVAVPTPSELMARN